MMQVAVVTAATHRAVFGKFRSKIKNLNIIG